MSTQRPPETVVVNADIRTMDPLFPRVEALAITNERVSALGDNEAISAMADAKTEIIDAGGRLVLPGFQDTHLHLQDGGMHFALNVKLDDTRTLAELQKRIADFAAANPQSAWINGGGWYAGIFGEHNLDRRTLDAVLPDRPAFLYRFELSTARSSIRRPAKCSVSTRLSPIRPTVIL